MININKVKSESLVMKKIFIIAIFMLLSAITLLSQTCEWAERIGGNESEEINGIITDKNSNVFITGDFNSDTVIFNNGKYLINSGNSDVFIAKYKSDGSCLWTEKIDSKEGVYVCGIILDSNENIFIAGMYCCETIYFNNDIYLTNSGNGDGYIAKYNSSGICQWAEKITGIYNNEFRNDDEVRKISIDNLGNIYVAGPFKSDTLFFNNGKFLTHFKSEDSFIAKYNNNGICQWADKIIGKKEDYISTMNIDEFGYIYISGGYDSDTIKFNNDIYLSNRNKLNSNEDDIYFAKYDNNGICQWAKHLPNIWAIALNKGNIFICGSLGKDSINFNNGKKLSSMGLVDGYICKYNNDGICQWVEQISGNKEQNTNCISIDADENIYVIGSYNSDSLFFNNGIFLTTKHRYSDFVAKYSGDGNCKWAEQIEGPFTQYFNKIVADNFGSVYVSGNFQSDTIKFNKGISIIGHNGEDSYLAKYSQSNTSVSDEKIQNIISIYPNPANDYIEINPDAINPTLKRRVDESSDIQIFNTLGEIILSVEQTSPSVQRIDISNLSPGMYFIKIGDRVEKFAKM